MPSIKRRPNGPSCLIKWSFTTSKEEGPSLSQQFTTLKIEVYSIKIKKQKAQWLLVFSSAGNQNGRLFGDHIGKLRIILEVPNKYVERSPRNQFSFDVCTSRGVKRVGLG